MMGRPTAGRVGDVPNEERALRLRPIAVSDTDRVHEWAALPEACRYQPWGPNTRADTETFIAEAVEAWTVRPQRRWVWAAVDPSDAVVGIGELKLRGPNRAEISYAVHVELWGQGIGSTIGQLLTGWAYAHLEELERLEATCDPRNVASESVLRHVGMTHEGTLRHVLRIRDGWRDSKMFSILRSEWVARQEEAVR
jgi:ribosomal-protein-alanine N-acetyltransferase